MKVLLLCMAFAAVSLAMPVAEENVAPAEPAMPVPAAAAKADEQPLADEKKPDPVPAVNEPEKTPEPAAKSAAVDVPAATPVAEVVEKETVVDPKIAAPAEPEVEKKPDPSEPKTEENLETKPADQSEQDKPTLAEKVIPEEGALQSAPMDIVIAANTNSGIADEPSVLDEKLSGRSEIPIAPTKTEVAPEPKKEEVAAEPAKPEENKPEIKAEEKAAEPASAEAKAATDAPRLVRDTVTEKPEAQAELKSAAPAAAAAEDKPKESDNDKKVSDEPSQEEPKPISISELVQIIDDKAVPTEQTAPKDTVVKTVPQGKSASTDDTPIDAVAPSVQPPASEVQPAQTTEEKPATENEPKPESANPDKPQRDESKPESKPKPKPESKESESAESNEHSSSEESKEN